MSDDTKPQLASAEDRLASILSTVAAKDFPDWWTAAIRDARAELINMREALNKIAAVSTPPISIARAALAPSPAGREG
jgi:hypothetical protein